MSIPKDLQKQEKGLSDWCILAGWRGSIAHNMYVPNSSPDSIDDKDTMHICVPPIEYYFGLSQYGSRGTKEIKHNEWDIVVYELRKFIGLLEKGNPNVIALLWLKEEQYITKKPAGQLILESRDIFACKNVYHSFSGYAHAQLYKMEHMACKGYMGQKRKALVEKFGYDTKNAAHLIRLLRMAIEFLGDGRMQVSRPDAKELLQIKAGAWSLEKVKKEAEELFKLSKEAFVRSKLPSEPNRRDVNQLCVNVIETFLDKDMKLEYDPTKVVNRGIQL